jgi:hypothetical protein
MQNVSETLFNQIQHYPKNPGPPSRLDVYQRKLEHDKMYLQSYELELLSQASVNTRDAQQRAELDILHANDSTRVDRIRLHVSNLLIRIANSIRPSDARRRDIASAR